MNNLIKAVIAAFYPSRCLFCGKLTEYPKQCCDDCFGKLPVINGNICEICGHPAELCMGHIEDICYERIVSALIYDGLVRKGIANFKFNQNKAGGELLAQLLLGQIKKHYSDIKFDCITCVPMTKKRIKQRGYNQAEVIAEYISSNLCIPLNKNLIFRTNDGTIQHNLRLSERKKNAAAAFLCRGGTASNMTILLIDDIITTSHTVNECCRQLKKAGAKKVYCASAATALKQKKHSYINN